MTSELYAIIGIGLPCVIAGVALLLIIFCR